MKKLPYILALSILSNLLLLSSEHERVYTENTCHRTYWGEHLLTETEREKNSECTLSRIETYDNTVKKHIAHVAYNPYACFITYLLVDPEYRKEGIGAELAKRAIEDMRANHNCRDIALYSTGGAVKFWEKLGAKSKYGCTYVFPDSSSNIS